jgi:hypothetical protein
MSSNKFIPDKEFNNIEIWETEEGRMKALFYIFIEYFHFNNNRISLPKNLDKNISIFENTIIHDNNFQKFAQDNNRVAL